MANSLGQCNHNTHALRRSDAFVYCIWCVWTRYCKINRLRFSWKFPFLLFFFSHTFIEFMIWLLLWPMNAFSLGFFFIPFFQNNSFWAQFECQTDCRLKKNQCCYCVCVCFFILVNNYNHQQLNNYYFFQLYFFLSKDLFGSKISEKWSVKGRKRITVIGIDPPHSKERHKNRLTWSLCIIE